MNWLNVQKINWEPPLIFASRFQNRDMALLYSGMREQYTGRASYLCVDPIDVKEGARWDELPEFGADSDVPDWVGYLGYEMHASAAMPASITLPNFRLVRYAHVIRFDHEKQEIQHYSRKGALEIPPPPSPSTNTKPSYVASNFSRAEYETCVAETVERIHAGDFYQANITRKFFGEYAAQPDSFALFRRLTEVSPAPYSAYIRHGNTAILSASPECFLSVDAAGVITTRPIKGSARRGKTEQEDAAIRDALVHSDKNLAENLMIVDLMRNDLARVSEPESVKVTEQSKLYSYATIHHLISTVRAQKRADVGIIDVARACFPPGSMTGAPKLAAIKWCAAQEKMARGVYSGAIGWFSGSRCDLSVVIRTLILKDNKFEFQVGGGIVADSKPEEEWQETLTKARGIREAMGLKESELEQL